MTMRNDKRGIAVFGIIAFIVLAVVIVYAIMYLPFSAFDSIRSLVNYILIIVVWILIQAGFVLGYYYLGKYAIKGWRYYKEKIRLGTFKAKNFLLSRM